MAQCKETAQEFIQDAFSPLVAVLCSPDVEVTCHKNNLSFVELIQPFCRLNTEAHIRDASNIPHSIRNLRVLMHDLNSHPFQSMLIKKMLNDVVSNALGSNHGSIVPNNVVLVYNRDLQLDATTPWFDAYRSAFLQTPYPSDHEFLRHYLACLFVVSTSNADPLEQLTKLTQQQQMQQNQTPIKQQKWFTPNILRYYVLVHDVIEQDEAKAESIYQQAKAKYGSQCCHLLHINSRQPPTSSDNSDSVNMPNPWIRYVTKRTETNENNDFAAFGSPLEDTVEFPSHVSEASIQPVSIVTELVELAIEAAEDDMSEISQNSTMDHPLAPETLSYDPLTCSDVMDNSSSSQSMLRMNNPIPQMDSSLEGSNRSLQLGACLTLSDHDRLRIFVNEFVTCGLIPWTEKLIRSLGDQVASRKGLHRSLFNPKKWFGGKQQNNPAVITNNTNVVYSAEAPEMQMRRLGDLAFMFQLYELAYQMYHAVKKDFNNDAAWIYYAGAMEMACLSVFMLGSSSQRSYPAHYMDTAITTYLTTCKVSHLATRAMLLSTEVLKAKLLYAEAAMQFMTMTSEESDLQSALLLEQAAHCFIKVKSPMVRKYAFHMVLAGHRFNKAGQKRHALRSYAQALQVFKSRNWTMAEDHINFTIGCQSYNIKQLDIATSAFQHLLSADSRQSIAQQSAFLVQYLNVFRQLSSQSPDGEVQELQQLPLPLVEPNSQKIMCYSQAVEPKSGSRFPASGVAFDTNESSNIQFCKLEELVVSSVSGSLPPTFKPTIFCFTSKTNNGTSPLVVVGESVLVELMITNPLKVALIIRDAYLLWKFVPDEDQNQKPSKIFSNEPGSNYFIGSDAEAIQHQPISEVLLEGCQTTPLHLPFTPRMMGQIQITGLALKLGCVSIQNPASSISSNPVIPDGFNNVGSSTLAQMTSSATTCPVLVPGMVNLEVSGVRLNATKEDRMSCVYATDKRLNLTVTGAMPRLEVYFCDFPSSLLCGEIRHIQIELCNTGQRPLKNVRISTTNPEFFTFGDAFDARSAPSGNVDPSWPSNAYRPAVDGEVPRAVTQSVSNVVLVPLDGILEPGGIHRLSMWIRGPDVPGEHSINLLFYYEPTEKVPQMSYRLVRHTAQIVAHPSIVFRSTCIRTTSAEESSEKASSSLLNSATLALEVENVCPVQDSKVFSVVQISCVSREWSMKCPGSLSTCRSIKGQESLYITLDMQKYTSCSDKKSTNVTFINLPLDNIQINTTSSVCTDFYFRSQFVVPFECAAVAGNSMYPNTCSSDKANDEFIARIEKAVSVDFSLVLIWKSVVTDTLGNQSLHVGQHHVKLERFNTLVSCPAVVKMPAELPPVKFSRVVVSDLPLVPNPDLLAQLVKFTLSYQSVMYHDFSEAKACVVPVVVHLLNCSDVELSIEINTQKPQDRFSQTPSDRTVLQSINPGRSTFTWIGQAAKTFQLSPDAVSDVKLTACLVGPGVFDLSNISVIACPLSALPCSVTVEPTIQRHLTSAFLTVHPRAAGSSV